MATLHGRNAVVYLQGSAATAVQISEANEWTINVDAQEVDDPAFGDTWRTKLRGLLQANGNVTGNFDTAQAGNAAFEAAIATSSRRLYLYPDAAVSARYYYGNVWPKLSVDVKVTDKGNFSMDFDVDGQLAVN